MYAAVLRTGRSCRTHKSSWESNDLPDYTKLQRIRLLTVACFQFRHSSLSAEQERNKNPPEGWSFCQSLKLLGALIPHTDDGKYHCDDCCCRQVRVDLFLLLDFIFIFLCFVCLQLRLCVFSVWRRYALSS